MPKKKKDDSIENLMMLVVGLILYMFMTPMVLSQIQMGNSTAWGNPLIASITMVIFPAFGLLALLISVLPKSKN